MTYGEWGSAEHHKRYIDKIPSKSRRRCTCGCKKRATHLGKANGVALMSGCEFSVRVWVRDGTEAILRR